MDPIFSEVLSNARLLDLYRRITSLPAINTMEKLVRHLVMDPLIISKFIPLGEIKDYSGRSDSWIRKRKMFSLLAENYRNLC